MERIIKNNEDMVNHPQHYQSESGLEVIDVIEAFTSNLVGIEAVCTGNVIKYICRWDQKNGLEDLKKARWYLEHLIEYLENHEDENVEEFIFESRREIENTLEQMNKIIEEHGFVTVADFYDARGLIPPYTSDKYGWTNLSDALVIKVREGYALRLPNVRRI